LWRSRGIRLQEIGLPESPICCPAIYNDVYASGGVYSAWRVLTL
jgi:hypothetical protein